MSVWAPPIDFDPYDHQLQDDPYPVYARLRRESPLHHNAEHDFWVLSRHVDVGAALRSDSAYSNAMGVSLDASAWNPQAHGKQVLASLLYEAACFEVVQVNTGLIGGIRHWNSFLVGT